jgi:hypothetical protein
MRILVAEDEKSIAAFIRKGLVEVGFNPLILIQGWFVFREVKRDRKPKG